MYLGVYRSNEVRRAFFAFSINTDNQFDTRIFYPRNSATLEEVSLVRSIPVPFQWNRELLNHLKRSANTFTGHIEYLIEGHKATTDFYFPRRELTIGTSTRVKGMAYFIEALSTIELAEQRVTHISTTKSTKYDMVQVRIE